LIVLIIGFSAASVQVVGVVLSLAAFFARIIILSRQLQFSIYSYLKNTVAPIVFAVIAGTVAPVVFVALYPAGIARFFITLLISTGSFGLSVFFIGFSKRERLLIVREINKYVHSKG
jgi:hypothetical protein